MQGQRKLGRRARQVFLATALLAFGVSSTASAEQTVTLTAGSPGGGYFKAAAAFAEYIKADIPGVGTTVIPGGGWANVERLDPEAKLADVAVLENALASMAYEGTGPNEKKYDFRMLAAIREPGAAQAVTVKDAGITSFEQIKEEQLPIRIGMFERHQLATAQALAVLEAYGITEDNVNDWGGKIVYTSLAEGVRMLMDGQLDMWFTGGSYYPHSKYIELGSKKAFLLMPISEEVAKTVADRFGQEIMEVPAGVYEGDNGENEAYWSPSTILTFGVRTNLDEDLVYEMTKALANHKEEFWEVHKMHSFYRPEVAWKNLGTAPLHPGAERYYKEMGYMP